MTCNRLLASVVLAAVVTGGCGGHLIYPSGPPRALQRTPPDAAWGLSIRSSRAREDELQGSDASAGYGSLLRG